MYRAYCYFRLVTHWTIMTGLSVHFQINLFTILFFTVVALQLITYRDGAVCAALTGSTAPTAADTPLLSNCLLSGMPAQSPGSGGQNKLS